MPRAAYQTSARRLRRRNRGGPRLLRNKRDLAEEVVLAEHVDPPAVLLHLDCALEDDDELASPCAFLRQHLPFRKVDLVRDRRDLLERFLRQPREERHVADQLDLGVLAEAHAATLRQVLGHV